MFACHADGMTRRDRFRGALLGLAVGDAVGTTVEFRPPGTFAPVTRHGRRRPVLAARRARGRTTRRWRCAWPRASSSAAAFDPVDQLERYVRWYRDGPLVEHRALLRHRQRDARRARALRAHRRAVPRRRRAGRGRQRAADEARAGRARLRARPAEAIRFAGESARTTHGAPEAIDAVACFAALLVEALGGERRSTGAARVATCDAASEGRGGRRRLVPARAAAEIRGGGYVVDALEAALWALRSTDDVRGRRARRGQPRRRRRHDRRDLRPARRRALRRSTASRALARAGPRHDEIVAFADALLRPGRRPPRDRAVRAHPAQAIHQCATPQDVADALALGEPFADPRRRPRLRRRLVDHGPADRHPPDARDRASTATP